MFVIHGTTEFPRESSFTAFVCVYIVLRDAMQILLEGPGSEMVDPNMQICPNYGVQRYLHPSPLRKSNHSSRCLPRAAPQSAAAEQGGNDGCHVGWWTELEIRYRVALEKLVAVGGVSGGGVDADGAAATAEAAATLIAATLIAVTSSHALLPSSAVSRSLLPA